MSKRKRKNEDDSNEDDSNKDGSKSIVKYKGVTKIGDRYRAQIRIDGKQKRLGSFSTITKAALAFDCAVLKNKLPSSWLNFVHK